MNRLNEWEAQFERNHPIVWGLLWIALLFCGTAVLWAYLELVREFL